MTNISGAELEPLALGSQGQRYECKGAPGLVTAWSLQPGSTATLSHGDRVAAGWMKQAGKCIEGAAIMALHEPPLNEENFRSMDQKGR